ncbi:MAG: TQO small subunit DoxD [Hyphomicrobium sp.]
MAHAENSNPAAAPSTVDLSVAALVLLGVRFVQGFIFWGGASRRLIYDAHEIAGVDHAVKLDFDLPGYVAAKLTHALPGALWVQGPIEWTLQHHDLIVTSVWLWTFAELAVGLGLMLGLATRASAFVSIWLNVVLMIVFGWMGSTCLDEWTMAVSGVAMSSAVLLSGAGAYSLDARFITGSEFASKRAWVPWIFSGPLPPEDAAKTRAAARPRLRTLHRRQLSDPVRRRRLAAALARQLPPP